MVDDEQRNERQQRAHDAEHDGRDQDGTAAARRIVEFAEVRVNRRRRPGDTVCGGVAVAGRVLVVRKIENMQFTRFSWLVGRVGQESPQMRRANDAEEADAAQQPLLLRRYVQVAAAHGQHVTHAARVHEESGHR